MSFFHNLNKTLDGIAARPEAAQLNERDMGKHNNATTGFKALAKKAGGGEKGEKIAGAQFQKMKKAGQLEEESMDEGLVDVVKKVGGMAKKAGSAVLNKVGHGDDVDMIRDLQRKMNMPQTGKKPEQKTDEAAKYRDAKYKDKLYTQEPRDYDQYDYGDDDYYNPKPADYPGAKRNIGGSEFDHNDPLRRGDGIGRSGIKNNILDRGPRKGLPSRDQITSLKGSIKSAKGTHAEPNLPEAGAPMTAKQKSFAALAEPKDKITFADKIAGAKKEVDEMLGDVAAEAMRNALGGRQQVADEGNAFTGKLKSTPKGGKFKMGNKEFTDTSSVDEEEDLNPFTNYKKPRADTPRTGEVTHGAKHDTEWTATGRRVTRRVDPQGNSVGSETDAEGNTIDKRGRGRPKGVPKGPERTTAKAYKHKGERKVKEGDMEEGADHGQAQQIFNDLAEIRAIAKQAQGGGQFPQGFASRLESVLYAAMTLIKNQQPGDAQVREAESTTKKDNHAERAGKRVAKDIEYDEKKKDGIHGKKRGSEDDQAEKAGKKVAKDIEHDDKKDDKKEDAPKKSKSKFKFGGSVYETLDAQLETLITEGMSVTVNMSQNSDDGHPGNKSITVNADGEDAERLAELLQMAGLSQQSGSCSSCGSSPCGCDMVDENNPNWPSNTETSDNALQYSGGLNGPKSTGQTTIPVIAGQKERMGQDDLSRLREMAGMRQNEILDEGMMDNIKGMLLPKLMKLLGPDAEKIANAVKQATGGDFTPSKENAIRVIKALGIDKAASQGQSQQMAEDRTAAIAGNWQGKLIQALYTLGLLGSAGAAASMWTTVGGSWFTTVGVLLLMFAGTFFGTAPGQVGAMGNFGNKGTSAQKGLDDHGMPIRNMNVDENALASQMRRQVNMEESAKVEQNLLNLYRTFGK